jgi:hypothetical protein
VAAAAIAIAFHNHSGSRYTSRRVLENVAHHRKVPTADRRGVISGNTETEFGITGYRIPTDSLGIAVGILSSHRYFPSIPSYPVFFPQKPNRYSVLPNTDG